jgi:hypothetical protein
VRAGDKVGRKLLVCFITDRGADGGWGGGWCVSISYVSYSASDPKEENEEEL